MKKQKIQVFTSAEMCEFMNIRRRQLANLVVAGDLPRFGQGRSAVFPLSALRWAELYRWRLASPHDCVYRFRLEMMYESDLLDEWIAFHGRQPTAKEALLPYMERRWQERKR
jgi:hypothetical protein